MSVINTDILEIQLTASLGKISSIILSVMESLEFELNS